jgi:prepilin-type N-terminal cleavage/methylation domain-containing protein
MGLLNRRSKLCRGFTLIEVMIVVFLIAVLLGIALPAFNHARSAGRASALISDLREIDGAKSAFIMANNLGPGAPVNDATDLVPLYLHLWPIGPVVGTYSANAVNVPPTFAGENADWYTQHCTGMTADAACPL